MNWLHDMTRLGYGWAIVLHHGSFARDFLAVDGGEHALDETDAGAAPEMAALKEKYKDDPQKYTQKQMELWKKHKVNPMGGCLPMLVQMPVFFGFFTMIRSAIELRGAHFLWVGGFVETGHAVHDSGIDVFPFISTPEGLPFNLLPLLMGGAMLWQSHLTPPRRAWIRRSKR